MSNPTYIPALMAQIAKRKRNAAARAQIKARLDALCNALDDLQMRLATPDTTAKRDYTQRTIAGDTWRDHYAQLRRIFGY